MIDRGIARDEYCCCNEAGEAIGVVDERFAFTDAGKKHCAGLCGRHRFLPSARFCTWKFAAEVQGASSGDAVLQRLSRCSSSEPT